MAEEVRAKYSVSKIIPVDIEDIIEIRLELAVIPWPNLRNAHDIYGFLSNDRTSIYVDSGMIKDPKFEAALRFTMAHELGHYFLHREFYEAHPITSANDWKALLAQIDGANLVAYEDQADEFAGRLLIPLQDLQSELVLIAPFLGDVKRAHEFQFNTDNYQQLLLNVAADRLAPKFNVPFEVMVMRMKREGIRF
ncbi:MAG: ImmA/IrrE family metallo-endopeptidase [Bacteroidetes bacterium]|nr:ImmA/IrrE family metallo-endopeptidase [Bacteroidota bacterium]